MGLSEVMRVSTTSFRPGARLITLKKIKTKRDTSETTNFYGKQIVYDNVFLSMLYHSLSKNCNI